MKRKLIQIITSIGINSYFKGFIEGNIYKGNLKRICVPGLNCYSCPGALGACPIGSLQAVISDIRYKFSFYVVGFLMLIGGFLGRFVCGWLCPFGFIEELLYKIPSPKFKVSKNFQKLKYLKYVILIVFVILLPLFWVDDIGIGSPTFCKYICPAGTIEGGIPLVILNESLRSAIGFLFAWKLTLLIVIVLLSIVVFRPFCRFVCPLGAIYSLFNPISAYRLNVDLNKCTQCGVCSKKCKLDIEVYKNPNSLECIRCGECIDACPHNAIKSQFSLKNR
ncbi:4Fe-4S binding protein [Tepidibacter thalassicus]|uniref:4Fe-4S binding domain-containing protein n=1 Tax=Tepidibacter thalassicus DSM 15285 TaxID=1123350 RepID=A0A1M5SKS9_9FIRM|nr:4Fe-4S binding protein [Tepidibacter thalassicus]SHH39156.1 4Fe-4S binding domain-containing protein [Tepidibacter thalassicus DSM 15285]